MRAIRSFRKRFTARWTPISDRIKELEEMLTKQRALNVDSPLGCAEYSLDGAEATVRTMLGLGTDYLDVYLFRGGSQFSYAAKGYESGRIQRRRHIRRRGADSFMPKYRAMKERYAPVSASAARRGTMTRAEPAAEACHRADDPGSVDQATEQCAIKAFLFVRSDMRGVSDLTLALKSVSQQQHHVSRPQRSGKARVIPAVFHLAHLRREQTRHWSL